eukprot:10037691-Alexandrium_andersonii.AAC.1
MPAKSLAQAINRFGHPCGFTATLIRRQTHPGGRALEFSLNVGLLSVGNLRRELQLCSKGVSNTGGLEGGRRGA